MAKTTREEDFFAHTTMSFGEHLEELRKVLFRAVIGLGIGFLVGLLCATQVVRFIERPLERAMERYYINRDLEEARKMLTDRGVSKKEAEATSARMAKVMYERQLSYSYMYVEESEVRRLQALVQRALDDKEGKRTAQESSDESSSDKLTVPDPTAPMLKIRVWAPVKAQITALATEEPFMIWLKAAFVTGLLLSSPYVFFQIWSFVAAGLYPHEQRYVHVFLPFSLALFLLGACTAFFLVFDPVLTFLMEFNRSMNIDPDPRISNWIGFVLFMPLGFGIAFQLPLVMLFINRIGIISLKAFAEKWRIAILVIFVISMILTPADPISMLAMAIPLTLLYFVGLGLCYWMPPMYKSEE